MEPSGMGVFRAYKFMTLQAAPQPHRAGSVGSPPISS